MNSKRSRQPTSPSASHEQLRQENTGELLDRLESYIEKEGLTDQETEELAVILDVLDETAPVALPEENPEEALRQFREKFAPILEAEPEPVQPQRRPRMARVLRVALAACLCLAALMMAASATGLIQWVMDWHEETYALRKTSPSGQMVLTDAPEGEFTSLAEAVAYYGIQDPVVPKWIPEEYVAQAVWVQETDNFVFFDTRYQGTNQELSIMIDWCKTGSVDTFFEHSDTKETIFSLNEIDFVLTHNEGQYRAAWATSSCTCSISGAASEEEMKQIIKSIFD